MKRPSCAVFSLLSAGNSKGLAQEPYSGWDHGNKVEVILLKMNPNTPLVVLAAQRLGRLACWVVMLGHVALRATCPSITKTSASCWRQRGVRKRETARVVLRACL